MGKLKNSFAAGLNFYKLFWLFIIFSILGYLFESAACFIIDGEIKIFRGLIYGPFSQIYGFGAVLIIIISQRFKKINTIILFLFCSIGCALYEYLCSYTEEIIFGFVSWEYSGMQTNIYGRTTFLFALVWGFLGVLIIKFLFPLFSKMIENIPNKSGIIITWLLIIFISLDIFITAAALLRQSERRRDIPPSNQFEVFLDSKYPDSFIKAIKPALQFK